MSSVYRTHTCGQLRPEHVGQQARLSGWVQRKRDHGNLLFIDLRDHYGVTQVVVDVSSPVFKAAEAVRTESVITVTGKVVAREASTVNARLATGAVELDAADLIVQSMADPLPIPVYQENDTTPEELRLKYRFLDLRKEKLHKNIILRSQVIASLRRRMIDQGFTEFQTPILTADSPEGARSYLVPSRLHPGKFYALPQAPQMFKQLLMVSGFDRYFQIAPCFRDEDARADRSPGEFYQLDFEMSFVTQDDVFEAIEPVLGGVFQEFASFNRETPRKVSAFPFPRIPFAEALLSFGTDKPDLRNPLRIFEVGEVFAGSDFKVFAGIVAKGGVVRAIRAPKAASQPRSFFDKLNSWAQGEGKPGLGYITLENGAGKGPIAKFVADERLAKLKELTGAEDGDSVFFVADTADTAWKFAGQARTKIGQELGVIDEDQFALCWVVDFPMFEYDDKLKKIDFSHNPFSMPQGGLEALETQDPLTIKAWQYDIVCNGIELCSGAIRNHKPDIMYKAFGIAGYSNEEVEARFGGMLNAFKFGAPPHGGAAPGVDRIVMLLADEPNIREIITFPMNQSAVDLMMDAPAEVPAEKLRELHIGLRLPPPRKD
ncbi:aspartate--tRNA ligase [Reyranella sp.]|jgi:aspartyl-tRNA synthetase|uniref:aspartate--tRNA ligase n=1 Tax=Reyranella sp. TaxID=1929291 RepID=UPI000BD84B3F|nr:aspartate--tRNA ligase [Reyranella sp.]OYY46129.1 MAG: aspartate--tRNA ligase [Rhodospirillales bacterium 35-66-84]OYZ96509.1 MAG: aspartate--tRNA ligase [Rhodospirillales bacterium 24-66-33]OZB28327.1 MAG: aspartate--tRNA ligase [Rhodospirillales bacterium 39-66-50]HQS14469.1 aspartate--tRNA ligase [Reyranella sp.]HQT11466.1 aspartate--tRNA ligase [Reyranella sp.]